MRALPKAVVVHASIVLSAGPNQQPRTIAAVCDDATAARLALAWNATRLWSTEQLLKANDQTDELLAAREGKPLRLNWSLQPGETADIIIPGEWAVISQVGSGAPTLGMVNRPGDPSIMTLTNAPAPEGPGLPITIQIMPKDAAVALAQPASGHA